MAKSPMRGMEGEILLALWKVPILCHAAEGPIYGQWISEELRRHSYAISPGTLHPLLRRMEEHGWLSPQAGGAEGAKTRRNYLLTRHGARALAALRFRVEELHRELVEAARTAARTRRRGRGARVSPPAAPTAERSRSTSQAGAATRRSRRATGKPRRETSK